MHRFRLALVGSGLLLALATSVQAQDNVERRLAEQDEKIRQLTDEVLQLKQGGVQEGSAAAGEAAAASADPNPIELGLFYIRTKDKAHELQLHSRIMLDGRFDAAHDFFNNTFQVRRARFTLEGHVFKHIGFKLGLEFGRTSDADVRDAYIQFKYFEGFQLWAGQMILPFSTSRLRSSNYMKHPERPIIVAALNGNRQIGGQLYGELFEKRFTWWLAMFNGNGQNVKVDNDDDKDALVRIELRPIKEIQISGAYVFTPTNRDSDGMVDLHTVGQQASEFLDFDQANNRRLNNRHRLNGGMMFKFGPAELKGEVNYDLQREMFSAVSGARTDLWLFSYFVDASWIITGEDQASVVKPNNPLYDLETGKWGPGAWEISARFEQLMADPDVRRRGFAVGSHKVRAATGTLMWVLQERTRVMLSYTYSDFRHRVADSDGKLRPNDHVVTFRMHFFF